MQPLVAHNLLLQSILEGSYLIWTVMEVIIEIRQRKRFHADAQYHDKGSKALLAVLSALGVVLCILLAYMVPATAITSARIFLFWLGMLLVYVGIAFRLYAIKVLGASFTTTIAVAAGQPVVEAGPYRLIRHPSYTGMLITLLGFGISYANWLSLLVLIGCVLIGLSYRIYVEEHVLQEHLGLRYREYMQHTKRLIPFVL
jgi:protein-S-isoprenylcysteine O-methyltransferase Ste14